eukprot:jgi/Astpho2/1687/e_gw1.00032.122.1_t
MPEEDKLLTQLVLKHGAQAWSFIASHFDGRHPGKSCRLRWLNQLDPGVNREPFSEWEDAVIVRGAEEHGHSWASIAKLLPTRRTDNAVKNRWNSSLKKWEKGAVQRRPRNR